MPKHIMFEINGYPEGKWNPVIHIFPVSAYKTIDPDVTRDINELKALLSEKPDLHMVYPTYLPLTARSIPHLPYVNAGMMIALKMGYLDFQKGAGIRLVTEFVQDTFPIRVNELQYTFQGLTNDGKYYVSADFPISASIPNGLPSPGNSTGEIDTYNRNLATILDEQPNDEYHPNIDAIDEMIKSIIIN